MPFDDRTGRDWPLPHADNHLEDDVERLRASLSAASDDITATEARAAALEARATAVEGRADALDGRADDAAGRIRALEGRADGHDAWGAALVHDDLKELQTGAWRHLTPDQLAAFPSLAAGDVLATERGKIPVVDLGARPISTRATVPDVQGEWCVIEGMGLYRLDRASAALLDGETAFLPASGSGRWVLTAPSAGLMFDMTDETFWTRWKSFNVSQFSVAGGASATQDIADSTLGANVIDIEAPSGFPLPWSWERTWSGSTGQTTLTFRNDRLVSVSIPAGTWRAKMRDRVDGAGLAARRALLWLMRDAQGTSALEEALAAAPANAEAFAALIGTAAINAAVLYDDERMIDVLLAPTAREIVDADAAAINVVAPRILEKSNDERGLRAILLTPGILAKASSSHNATLFAALEDVAVRAELFTSKAPTLAWLRNSYLSKLHENASMVAEMLRAPGALGALLEWGWPNTGYHAATMETVVVDPYLLAILSRGGGDAKALYAYNKISALAASKGLYALVQELGWTLERTDEGSASATYNGGAGSHTICRGGGARGLWFVGSSGSSTYARQAVTAGGVVLYSNSGIASPTPSASQALAMFPASMAADATIAVSSAEGPKTAQNTLDPDRAHTSYWKAELWVPPEGWEEAQR